VKENKERAKGANNMNVSKMICVQQGIREEMKIAPMRREE